MIRSYYFWKWADNDLPGRPTEVLAALLRGKLHPALQTFDARPLLKKLESAAAAGLKHVEEWEWQVTPAACPESASFVFVTCPQLDRSEPAYRRFIRMLPTKTISGCDEARGMIIQGLRPKINCFITGQLPWETAYDIREDDLPFLIRRIDPRDASPFGILEDRQHFFVQCSAQGRRFIVEWANNRFRRGKTTFDQWRAQDRVRLARLDVPYDKDTPPSKDPDLLLFADTLQIFQAFLRREPRPPRYHWMNINSWLEK